MGGNGPMHKPQSGHVCIIHSKSMKFTQSQINDYVEFFTILGNIKRRELLKQPCDTGTTHTLPIPPAPSSCKGTCECR